MLRVQVLFRAALARLTRSGPLSAPVQVTSCCSAAIA